jgi:hypothetical protein
MMMPAAQLDQTNSAPSTQYRRQDELREMVWLALVICILSVAGVGLAIALAAVV